MGLFDWVGDTGRWLGDRARDTGQWIGQAAKDTGTFIGDTVAPIVPVLKGVLDNAITPIANFAEMAGIPMAGAIRRGSEWASNAMGSGLVQHALNGIQGTLNGVGAITDTIQKQTKPEGVADALVKAGKKVWANTSDEHKMIAGKALSSVVNGILKNKNK